MQAQLIEPRLAIAEDLGRLSLDPLGFCNYAFPWGIPGGPLETEALESWQEDLLGNIGEDLRAGRPAQYVMASGHGVGKSSEMAIIGHWGLSTIPGSRVQITANKADQLRTKTWPEVSKWYEMFILKDDFKFEKTSICAKVQPETWRWDHANWSERGTSGFAGLHNKGNRVVLLFDEASEIPGEIFDAAQGAFSDADTERVWVVFGNPTRLGTRFHDLFGRLRKYWHPKHIDSRSVRRTDKEYLNQIIETHGIDSIQARVRVLGLFPLQGDNQWFDPEIVEQAFSRSELEVPFDFGAAVIYGLDVARSGDDASCLVRRQGYHATHIWRWHEPDSMKLVREVAYILGQQNDADAIFVDATGVGGPVHDRLRELNFPVREFRAADKASTRTYYRFKDEMMGRLAEWLPKAHIVYDEQMKIDFLNVFRDLAKDGELKVMSKDKSPGPSPDAVDALSFTMQPVMRKDAWKTAVMQQQQLITAARQSLDSYEDFIPWHERENA